MYNLFLKESLDDYSPFFNKELPLPILNLNGSTNKKEFNEFCRSISYDYIATKFNFNSKKVHYLIYLNLNYLKFILIFIKIL